MAMDPLWSEVVQTNPGCPNLEKEKGTLKTVSMSLSHLQQQQQQNKISQKYQYLFHDW